MTLNRKAIEEAILTDRLFVRVGDEWFRAADAELREFSDGDWIVLVRGGPHKRLGYITSAEENDGGWEFWVAPYRQ